MAKTSADILIDTLRNWGVNTVFGLPGDGIKKSLRAQEQQAPERAGDARSIGVVPQWVVTADVSASCGGLRS
jgi:hypothetical protein